MNIVSAFGLSTLLAASMGYFGQVFVGTLGRYYFFDVFLGICILWVFLSKKRIASLWVDKRMQPFVVFFLTLLVSFLLNVFGKDEGKILVAGFYLVRVLGLICAYSLFLRVERKNLTRYLSLALLVFIGFGVVQYLLIPDTRVLSLLGFDDHYFRMIGSFLDPNFMGLALVFCVLYFLSRSKHILVILCLLCLALTFSRSAFLAMTAGLLIYVFLRRKLLVLLYVPIFLLFVYFSPKPFGEGVNLGRTYSIESRVQNTKNVVASGFSNLLYGEGYNFPASEKDSISEKGYVNRGGGIDNSLLLIFVSSGVLGLLGFVYLVMRIWQRYFDSVLVMSGGGALVVHSLTNNSLFFVPIMIFFVAILALENKKSLVLSRE